MELHIGPYVYKVYLWRGLIDHEGQKCLGLCDHDQQCVLVSDTVSGDRRLQVLCHEAWHAWRHHFGSQDSTLEGEADLVGLMMVQLMKDLEGKMPLAIEKLDYTMHGQLPDDRIAAKYAPK